MIKFSPADIRTWSLLGQRGTFGKIIYDIASENKHVIAMTADQATGLGLHRLAKQFPDQFLNLGISEQNSVGVAAGLANEGFIPFLAFQAAFASLRCADQTHAAMAYMKENIKLIGMFSGLTQSDCGPTHLALHDFALYRSFPNIVVLSPCDSTEFVKMIESMLSDSRPAYIRIGGPNNIPVIYKQNFDFKIGKAITLKEGRDITLIATGSMVFNTLKASEFLEKAGFSVKVVDMHTLKPLDVSAVQDACNTKLIVSIEEHSVIGGLGSAIAEELSLRIKRPPHLIIGISGDYPHAASYPYLLEQFGLTAERLAIKIKETYEELTK